MLQAVDALSQHSDLARTESVAAEAKALAERLAQAEKDAVVFNSREGLLGLPSTDYSALRKLVETFEPYSQFWTTAAAWQVRAWPSGASCQHCRCPPLQMPTTADAHHCRCPPLQMPTTARCPPLHAAPAAH
jgi:hypothetical protein